MKRSTKYLLFGYIFILTCLPPTVQNSPGEDMDPKLQRTFPVRLSSCESTRPRSFSCIPNNKQPNHIRVAVLQWLPYIHVTNNGSCVLIRGPMAELLHVLSQKLHFTYTCLMPDDRQWGTKKNGNWTGMIGMVSRNEADLIMTPVSITIERLDILKYTSPIMIDSLSLLVRNPSIKLTAFSLFSAYQWKVWITLISAILVISSISNRMFHFVQEQQEGGIKSFMGHLWVYSTSVLFQGMTHLPQRISLRLLVGSWWLGCFVLMASFSGHMMSMFAIKQPSGIIDSIEDLLDYPEVVPMIERGASFEKGIMNSDIPSYEKLWKSVQEGRKAHPVTTDITKLSDEEQLNMVEAGTRAVVGQDATIRALLSNRYSSKGKCDFHVGKKQFFTKISSLSMSKALPPCFHKTMEKMVVSAVEQNLIFDWINKITGNYTTCVSRPSQDITPLILSDFQGVLYSWGCGIILSSLTFMMEKFSSLCGKLYLQR
ncbi:glutamate receptor ionotropic, kainate glr-3-like [Tachypleus tridentatus]|uniref:glutamate receptor ionotropic, kainate glr-3-like n=1 Tax=Tachypleus tridentatus TaxID=6853 RepID=UPI003FD0F997